jgi:hypothetical protein
MPKDVVVRWEYLMERTRTGEAMTMAGLLNNRGKEGWELVTAVPEPGGILLIFKRPLPADDKVYGRDYGVS